MPQPIPSNSIRPLTVGERVQIIPELQDLGDEEFERVVIEAPVDSPRVLIRTLTTEHPRCRNCWSIRRSLRRFPFPLIKDMTSQRFLLLTTSAIKR